MKKRKKKKVPGGIRYHISTHPDWMTENKNPSKMKSTKEVRPTGRTNVSGS